MSINFDKQLRIAGYKPVLFKNAIRGFMRTNSPGCMIELKSLFSHRRDGAIVFDECLDRSFIEERDGLVVTAAGEALALGRARPRTPLAKALPVLDDFLTRVDAMNRDGQAVRYVDEVWLFGSVLRQAQTVGDIDLALVTQRRPQYSGRDGYRQMLSHLKRLYGATIWMGTARQSG